MKQCKRWPGARFAVGYAGPIVMVVKPQSHRPGRVTIVSPQGFCPTDRLPSRLETKCCAIAEHCMATFVIASEMQDMEQMRNSPLGFAHFASCQCARVIVRLYLLGGLIWVTSNLILLPVASVASATRSRDSFLEQGFEAATRWTAAPPGTPGQLTRTRAGYPAPGRLPWRGAPACADPTRQSSYRPARPGPSAPRYPACPRQLAPLGSPAPCLIRSRSWPRPRAGNLDTLAAQQPGQHLDVTRVRAATPRLAAPRTSSSASGRCPPRVRGVGTLGHRDDLGDLRDILTVVDRWG